MISVAQSFLRIPKDRIAVLIGEAGKTKKKIGKQTNCKISVNSKTGEITIESGDAGKALRAKNIIKAIGRGFSPRKALLLAQENYALSIINLKEFLGKSKKAINQKKARVIGRNGNTRKRIEKETNCYVSVYGNTIGIIGLFEDLPKAESVIYSILEGANISTAFEMLKERLMEEKKFEL